MSGQEERFGDEPEMEKKVQKNKREAGHDKDGEPSAEALKRWFIWAGLAVGVCLAVACVLAFVYNRQNQKAAVILEAEVDEPLRLTLNRKGGVLEAPDTIPESLKDAEGRLSGTDSLEETCQVLFEAMAGPGYLDSDGAGLFTVRPVPENRHVDLERMAEEIGVCAETFLKKKQSKGTVYVGAIDEERETGEISEKYGCSLGKAALVKDLTDRNVRVKTAEQSRLAGLSMGQLSGEVARRGLTTSFLVVTAGRVYQVKTEETKAETSGAAETETETTVPETAPSAESETAGASESSQPVAAETTAPETKAPETAAAETTAPETRAPETAAAETTVPETRAPETAAAETTVPETRAPETVAAETTVPETRAPETAAAQTTAPETRAPETAAAETTAPSSLTQIITETATLTPATSPQEESSPQVPETGASGRPLHVGPGYEQRE